MFGSAHSAALISAILCHKIFRLFVGISDVFDSAVSARLASIRVGRHHAQIETHCGLALDHGLSVKEIMRLLLFFIGVLPVIMLMVIFFR